MKARYYLLVGILVTLGVWIVVDQFVAPVLAVRDFALPWKIALDEHGEAFLLCDRQNRMWHTSLTDYGDVSRIQWPPGSDSAVSDFCFVEDPSGFIVLNSKQVSYFRDLKMDPAIIDVSKVVKIGNAPNPLRDDIGLGSILVEGDIKSAPGHPAFAWLTPSGRAAIAMTRHVDEGRTELSRRVSTAGTNEVLGIVDERPSALAIQPIAPYCTAYLAQSKILFFTDELAVFEKPFEERRRIVGCGFVGKEFDQLLTVMDDGFWRTDSIGAEQRQNYGRLPCCLSSIHAYAISGDGCTLAIASSDHVSIFNLNGLPRIELVGLVDFEFQRQPRVRVSIDKEHRLFGQRQFVDLRL